MACGSYYRLLAQVRFKTPNPVKIEENKFKIYFLFSSAYGDSNRSKLEHLFLPLQDNEGLPKDNLYFGFV